MAEKRKNSSDFGGQPHNKKGKKHFAQHARNVKHCDVQPGMKGIMFTVNPKKDRDAITEIKCLLAPYATDVNPIESSLEKQTCAESAVSSTSESISSLLQLELAQMKKGNQKYSDIYVKNTQVPGNFFVEIKGKDPFVLVKEIAQEIARSEHFTRFVFRMIPIHTVCSAYIPTIREEAKTLWNSFYQEKIAPSEAAVRSSASDIRRTFAIKVKSRNNTGGKHAEEELTNELGACIDKTVLRTDLKRPDIVIWVLTLQNLTFLGVGEQVTEFHEFNIHSLAACTATTTTTNSTATTSSTATSASSTSNDSEEELHEEESRNAEPED